MYPRGDDEQTRHALGVPVFQEAQFETRGDGPGALTVRRQHYQLVVNVFLGDLLLALALLERRGLLAVRTPRDAAIREEYPTAPEYSAVVLPALIGPRVRQLVFFDDARTRRIVYPGPIHGIEPHAPAIAIEQIRAVQEEIHSSRQWSTTMNESTKGGVS